MLILERISWNDSIVESLKGFGLNNEPLLIKSTALALDYVDKNYKGKTNHIHSFKRITKDGILKLAPGWMKKQQRTGKQIWAYFMMIPVNAGDLMQISSKEIILTALPVLVQGHKKHDFSLESHLGV